MDILLNQEKVRLLPEKALYWYRHKALLLSDLHLGKAAHFRKEGIPVPHAVQARNLKVLGDLVRACAPERVLFLGDLFHSDVNEAWVSFTEFLYEHPGVSFELVLGNHDILDQQRYFDAGLSLHFEPYLLEPFILSHHPHDELIDGWYNLHGHIHPSVSLEGPARQTLRLPCFHFGPYHGILPAFGAFTGTARMPVTWEDKIFVIAEGKVLEM